MKILIVQPTSDKRGHYGIWTTRMCQALGKMGHEVTLCTNKAYPDRYIKGKLLFDLYEVKNGKYNFEHFDAVRSEHPLHYFYGYFKVCYLITAAAFKLSQRKHFDVIFITDAEFLMASILLKRFSRRIPPVVMQVNAANFSFSAYSGSFIKKTYKLFQRTIFKSTLGKEIKGFAVLGQWHQERLRPQLALDESFPIDVVPDVGQETDGFIETAEARKMLRVDYTGDLLLFFGMFRKDKGIADLLEAMRYVKSKDFKLMVVGAPTEYTEEEVRKIIDENNITEKVILRPEYVPDEDVAKYFYSADALIMPYASIYTGGSGPLLKGACTFKKPVVVTDVSEMGRLTREHGMGLLAEPDNPRSLAACIDKFLSLPGEERQEMSRKSEGLAKTNSWEAMTSKLTQLFEKAAKAS